MGSTVGADRSVHSFPTLWFRNEGSPSRTEPELFLGAGPCSPLRRNAPSGDLPPCMFPVACCRSHANARSGCRLRPGYRRGSHAASRALRVTPGLVATDGPPFAPPVVDRRGAQQVRIRVPRPFHAGDLQASANGDYLFFTLSWGETPGVGPVHIQVGNSAGSTRATFTFTGGPRPNPAGFGPDDVLYLIMVDRFARGAGPDPAVSPAAPTAHFRTPIMAAIFWAYSSISTTSGSSASMPSG